MHDGRRALYADDNGREPTGSLSGELASPTAAREAGSDLLIRHKLRENLPDDKQEKCDGSRRGRFLLLLLARLLVAASARIAILLS
ncbi:hypothetical protein MTO96_013942 [Rhipicephalus appendiculatus]